MAVDARRRESGRGKSAVMGRREGRRKGSEGGRPRGEEKQLGKLLVRIVLSQPAKGSLLLPTIATRMIGSA
jgi:hypothetical protein